VSEAAIAVEGLVKRYGGRAVVDGVSLEVRPGELVALLGPNGAGKTTTVETIEGYRRPDAGRVRVLGGDPARGGREGRALRARVGLMLQSGGVDMRARPRETLRQYAGFHAEPLDPDELVETLGLTAVADTPYRRLSGGERQRLSLAMALVGRPDVLILDEPTAGMDPEARVVVRRLVADLRASGLAIMLTSHDLTDVERLADRILVLVDGVVVTSGGPAELTAGLRPSLRVRLDRPLAADEQRALAEVAGATVVEEDGRYRLDGVAPDPATVAAVAAWCAGVDRLIVELRTVGGSLEDAYLELVSGREVASGGADRS
jgi:ABC-2 type transport system ATP-binding protein